MKPYRDFVRACAWYFVSGTSVHVGVPSSMWLQGILYLYACLYSRLGQWYTCVRWCADIHLVHILCLGAATVRLQIRGTSVHLGTFCTNEPHDTDERGGGNGKI